MDLYESVAHIIIYFQYRCHITCNNEYQDEQQISYLPTGNIVHVISIRLWRRLHSNTLKVAACQFQPNKSKYDKNEYSHNLVGVSHKVSDQNYVLSFLSDIGNERKSQS
jgi:hypothetical protein